MKGGRAGFCRGGKALVGSFKRLFNLRIYEHQLGRRIRP